MATELLPLDVFPPAPGQGAICVEQRSGDLKASAMLAAINHRETALALACERAFLAQLDGSCRTPIAGLATVAGDWLDFSGMVLTPDGKRAHNIEASGAAGDAAAIGEDAGRRLRDKAGPDFFADWV